MTYSNSEAGITTEAIETHFKNAHTKESLARIRKHIGSMPDNSKMFVAEYDGKIVGVCRIYRREEYNQLQAIYVLPEFQGKGIGILFWNACVEFFVSHKDAVVYVATYNLHAIAFYIHLGFQDTGVRFFEERHRMPVSHSLIPEMEMRKEKALLL